MTLSNPDTENADIHPLITVGITCFNAEQTIARAIRSALAQDWPNLEVVVVDDASTDQSWMMIERMVAEDARVKPLRHAVNGGAAAARNSLIAAASGEWLAFFDDDDESLPERVRVQHDALCQYETETGAKLIACYATGLRRYPNGYALNLPAIGSQPIVPYGELVADYLLFNDRRSGVFYGAGTPTCSLMSRLSTFKSIGGFDTNLRRVEDVDFAIRLALSGGHFIGCPQHLFTQYATEASDKTPSKNLEAELQLIDKHMTYLKSRKRYGYARDWFHIRYFHFSRQRLKFFWALFIFLLRHPLSGTTHLLRSAPNRLLHERGMQQQTGETS